MNTSMNAKLAAILLALLTFGVLEPASAYWDKEWTIRKQITIDPGAAGTPIDRVQLARWRSCCVCMTETSTFAEAKDDGSDIRFVASDDKTLLPYHLREVRFASG